MSHTASNHTVFVVDDDAAVTRAIARVLRANGWRVETFGSAEAFLARPDDGELSGCLVLDVNLPGLDGLALQQQLRETGETLPIVFLTGYGDIPMSVRAIKAGAADFLTKPVAEDALDAAIRAAIEQHAARRRDRSDGDAIRRRMNALTPREREVLTAVIAGKLNKQIAFDLGIVEQTVKYHRAHIMERMQAKSVAELMHLVARAQDE
jgi:FixJ family two-component response regulator